MPLAVLVPKEAGDYHAVNPHDNLFSALQEGDMVFCCVNLRILLSFGRLDAGMGKSGIKEE
jgi:hypothetical protein